MGDESNIEKLEVSMLEPLHNPSDEDIDGMIANLGYDALDSGPKEDRLDRAKDMKRSKLRENFLRAGKHGELFVHRDHAGNIVGLIGMRVDPNEHTGHISLLRTSTRERQQEHLIEGLLTAAEHYLRQSPRSCTHAVIESENPSGYLRMAAHRGERSRFYEISEKSDESGVSTDSLEQPY